MANNPRLTESGRWSLPDRAPECGTASWSGTSIPGCRLFSSCGSDADASERYWANVCCPVSIIAGDLAGEYWRSAMPPGSDWSGDFAPGELEARVGCFPDAELIRMPGSGHMVHFDEPEALARATLDFYGEQL